MGLFRKALVGINESGKLMYADASGRNRKTLFNSIEPVRVPISYDMEELHGAGIVVATFNVGDFLLGAISGVSVSEAWDSTTPLLYLFEEGETPGDAADNYDLTQVDDDGSWGGSSLLTVHTQGGNEDQSQVSAYLARAASKFNLCAVVDDTGTATQGSGTILLAIARA